VIKKTVVNMLNLQGQANWLLRHTIDSVLIKSENAANDYYRDFSLISIFTKFWWTGRGLC